MLSANLVYFYFFISLYIYPPDSQESDRAATQASRGHNKMTRLLRFRSCLSPLDIFLVY